jgi:phosphoglycolate phosphatase-like HAD superfamily hydrolase
MDSARKTKPKLYLFDVDLTLILTAGCGRRAFAKAFQEISGVSQIVEKISMTGKTDTAILKEALQLGGLTEISSEIENLFWKRYLGYLKRELNRSKEAQINPGIPAILNSLSEDSSCCLGLLTGNIRAGAKIKLEHFGLWSCFPTGGFGDDAEDRSMVAQIAAARCSQEYNFRFEPENIYVIGDSLLDISCAKAIHAQAVAVATGVHDYETLQAQKPYAVFKNFSNPESILKLLKNGA